MQQLTEFVIKMQVYGFILGVAIWTVAIIAALCYGVYALIKKWRRKRNRVTVEQAVELARFTLPDYKRGGWVDEMPLDSDLTDRITESFVATSDKGRNHQFTSTPPDPGESNG